MSEGGESLGGISHTRTDDVITSYLLRDTK